MSYRKQTAREFKDYIHAIIKPEWFDYQVSRVKLLNKKNQTAVAESDAAFYRKLENTFRLTLVDDKSVFRANELLARFIRGINRELKKEQQMAMPLQPHRVVMRHPLGNDETWLRKGRHVAVLRDVILEHWSCQTQYTCNEKLGWLIVSAVVFGGINDKMVLRAYLETLVRRHFKGDAFCAFATVVSVRYQTKTYGNERVKATPKDQLFSTQQIVIDNVSRLWLKALQLETDDVVMSQSLDYYVNHVLSPLREVVQQSSILRLNTLCGYASYVWQQLPDVDIDMAKVNMLTGKTKTLGLKEADFQQYLITDYPTANIPTDNINIGELVQKKVWITSAKGESGQAIATGHSQQKAKTQQTNAAGKLYRRIRKATQSPNAMSALAELRHQTSHQLAKRFIAWIMALFKAGNIEQSSILNYVESIGRQLIQASKHSNIDACDAEDFEDIYAAVLEHKSDQSISRRAYLLFRFHRFHQGYFDAPPIDMPYFPIRSQVAAQVVSPALFQQLINQLDQRLEPEDAVLFKLIFILAYRTGMRKREILGLSFFDIEGRYSNEPNIIVRANQHRSIKSQSARRRVNLTALLKPDEMTLFLDYIALHMPIKTKLSQPVFSLSTDNLTMPAHVPLQLLKTIMSDILGDNSFTFHSLRHTAVTNMALVFAGHADLQKRLTDYDDMDAKRIKASQLGRHTTSQLNWYAISGLVGHLSPETSIKTYCHTGYLQATFALFQTSLPMSINAITHISGISRRRLRDNLGKNETLGTHIDINKLSKLLFKETNAQSKHKPINTPFDDGRLSLRLRAQMHQNQWDEFDLYKGHGIGRILKLLAHIEQHNDVRLAANQFGMREEHAVKFYQNALTLSRLRTQVSTYRLRSRRSKPHKKVVTLLPSQLHETFDRARFTQLVYRAKQVHDNDPLQLQSCIDTIIQKISMRDAFISFPIKQQRQMEGFLIVATQLLPEREWLIHVPNDEVKKAIQHRFPLIQLQVTNTSTCHVGIRYAKDGKNKKQFSALLRYVGYVMGVVVTP